MDRISFIREEEKKYHDFCYENYKLFEQGSWLYKPVQTVIDQLPSFYQGEGCKVLDLGCGVGRNSIPLAKELKASGGKVVCVDLLKSAIEKLADYSREYGVADVIEPIKADIGEFVIEKNEYDYIVAVSSIEHVARETTLDLVLKRVKEGTKMGGGVCLIVNSDVVEYELNTNTHIDALMEVNLSTDKMLQKLHTCFLGWEVIKEVVKPLEYTIVRNGKSVALKTKAITFVARRVMTKD